MRREDAKVFFQTCLKNLEDKLTKCQKKIYIFVLPEKEIIIIIIISKKINKKINKKIKKNPIIYL